MDLLRKILLLERNFWEAGHPYCDSDKAICSSLVSSLVRPQTLNCLFYITQQVILSPSWQNVVFVHHCQTTSETPLISCDNQSTTTLSYKHRELRPIHSHNSTQYYCRITSTVSSCLTSLVFRDQPRWPGIPKVTHRRTFGDGWCNIFLQTRWLPCL